MKDKGGPENEHLCYFLLTLKKILIMPWKSITQDQEGTASSL